MWLYMSLGIGLRETPGSVGFRASVHPVAGGAPLQLVHQSTDRDDGTRGGIRGLGIVASSRQRPPVKPSREATAPQWTGPAIDLTAEPAPVQRGQLIDILV